MKNWPVYKKQNQLDYNLEVPTIDTYKNKSMKLLPNLKKEYTEMKVYFDTTTIKCDALAGIGKKVAINAEGLVLPCNLLNHNLYDARFRDNSLPGANDLSTVDEKNQVRTFLEKYGFDNLNINYHTLTNIFLNPFWEDLVASWTNENRLFECAMSCGNKLSKVWDQGGSIR